jgi:hypothetical protein
MAKTIDRISAAPAAERAGHRPRPGFADSLEELARAFDGAIRRHENLVLTLALALVIVFSLLFAWRKPFDIDEYLVHITALAGSPAAVWNLLKTAPLSVDPPLYHFLVHYCLRIFGPSEFFTRLPSVLAYSSMCFFLYRFLRRYADVYTGLLVLALCLLCGAFPFAYYARPYALVLAADTLALFCWESLVERRPGRGIALLGLFLGIAIAVGSHWFGFLVLVPLIVGEGMRMWQTRRIDAAVWATFVAAACTALAYLPLLKAATAYRALPWKGVALGDISASFQLVLEPCIVPLLLLVILAFARSMFSSPSHEVRQPGLPTPVFVCVAAFALTPFAGFILGKLVTHAFQPRYVLFCSVGLVLLVALASREAMAGRVPWMVFAVFMLGGCTTFLQYHALAGIPSGGDTAALADVSVFSANASLPVVAGSDGLFLRIEAHAPVSLRQRCVFPFDQDFVRILHNNTNFLMTEGLRRWTQLPIPELSSFLNAHPKFYFIQIPQQDWVIQRMLEDHADIALQGTYAGNSVYLVDLRH